MKKLSLLIAMLMSMGAWGDMDKICIVNADSDIQPEDSINIRKKCERNNILRVDNLDSTGVTRTVARYCRFDREINTIQREEKVNGYIAYDLTCVLYSKNARQLLASG